MKKILATMTLLCLLFQYAKAQTATFRTADLAVTNTSSSSLFKQDFLKDSSDKLHDYEYYSTVSSNKNTAAWVLVSGGALSLGIGLLSFPKDYDLFGNSKSKENQAKTSYVLVVVGIAAMLSSIPFFVSSSLYKHKAHLALGSQKTGFGIPVKTGKEITGLTYSIPLGR